MDPVWIGVIGFIALLFLLLMGVPIAVSMALPGIVGAFYFLGVQGTFAILPRNAYSLVSNVSFTAVPLFLLMGYAAMHGRLTTAAYDTAGTWLNRLPGGLAMATCAACGLFGAVCGSGVSATAAMGRLAVPEMLKRGYDKGLATGSVASAATVAALIPPSILMVIYSVVTEASLGKLLLAGYLPGILSIVIFILMIGMRVHLKPSLAPRETGQVITWSHRFKSLKQLWGVLVLIAILMGGLYSGLFTATEIAAVAALTTFVIVIITKNFAWDRAKEAFFETLKITCMALLMMIGANFFNLFITLSGLPREVAAWIAGLGFSSYLFIIAIAILYVFLGMFLDSISMLLLTMPVLLPVLTEMKVDLIWFGIIWIKLAEIGAITPPVGMSVYVLKGTVGDAVPLGSIFRGIWWFLAMEFLTLVLLVAFPMISLLLPNTMGGR